jgi:broad specificity phosphatase PhoE
MRKNIGFIWVLGIVVGFLSGCASHTVYIVRHAEKASAPANDPPLTAVGQQRALALRDSLRGKEIGLMYSTNTLRTRSTAEPLAQAIGVPIKPYSTDTLWEMARHLAKLHRTNALVVGHSNTLLPLLDQLPVTHQKKEIPESDYDNLFVVTVKRRFLRPPLIRLQEKTYGALAE